MSMGIMNSRRVGWVFVVVVVLMIFVLVRGRYEVVEADRSVVRVDRWTGKSWVKEVRNGVGGGGSYWVWEEIKEK